MAKLRMGHLLCIVAVVFVALYVLHMYGSHPGQSIVPSFGMTK